MPKQTFEELVLTALKSLQDGQAQLQKDVSGLQRNFSSLQKDVRRLEAGQVELQKDVRRLEAGQVELQKDVRRLEVLYEEMAGKIDQIIEVVKPEMVKNNEQDARLNGHDEDLLVHDGRLNILESV